MQWDEQELNTQFTPNVYFSTPNSEILAKALLPSIELYAEYGPKSQGSPLEEL